MPALTLIRAAERARARWRGLAALLLAAAAALAMLRGARVPPLP